MNILFISSNNMWSGSEQLWYETALLLSKKAYKVTIATKYQHHQIDTIIDNGVDFINLNPTPKKRPNRIFNFIGGNKNLGGNHFEKEIIDAKPSLVIISQGSNIDSVTFFELCIANQFKFITITQLVSDVHWLWLTSDLRNRLIEGYISATKNYFVSIDNMIRHQSMLASKNVQDEVLSNPSIISGDSVDTYPSCESGYCFGFVGRIECFHKGLDILVKIIAQPKWQSRSVKFNFYGEGPHKDIIQSQLKYFKIHNLYLHGHTDSIKNVWNQNHICILPSRMEGQSLSLLEAIHCKRTAIVTNVGGAMEILKDNETAFIAKFPDFDSIDEAMERAWLRKDEWEKMGMMALEANKTKNILNAGEVLQSKIIEILED